MKKFSNNLEKKIDEIKNKNIKNSLSQLFMRNKKLNKINLLDYFF